VLIRVKVPHDKAGAVAVASVELGYRDLATGGDGRCGGKLALEVVPDAAEAADIDPLVSGRVQRSETAAVLQDANHLFEQGRLEEARRSLVAREQTLKGEAEKAKKAAPAARAKDVDRDFESQLAAVGGASSGFAEPPPFANAPAPSAGAHAAAAAPRPQATRAGKSAVRENQERATSLGF
jgi:Ca-activated chloride channel family protein